MYNSTLRSEQNHCQRLRNRMVYMNEFNAKASQRHNRVFCDSIYKRVHIVLPGISQLYFCNFCTEFCSKYRSLYLSQKVGQTGHMIFMGMSDDNTFQLFSIFYHICTVLHNFFNTYQPGIRKNTPTVYYDHILATLIDVHIFSDLPYSSKRNDLHTFFFLHNFFVSLVRKAVLFPPVCQLIEPNTFAMPDIALLALPPPFTPEPP